MALDISEKKSIIGRSLKDIEKYGERGTAYLGKVVMSSGERPVLGRKILCDVTRPHVMLICGKRGGGKCLDGDTLITLADGSVRKIRDLEGDEKKVVSLGKELRMEASDKTEFFKRKVNKTLKLTLRSGKEITLTPEHPLFTIDGWRAAEELGKGARIATPRRLGFFGEEFLRECEVKLLAYLLAEGHTKGKVVWFSNDDKKIISEFRAAVKEFDNDMEVKFSGKNSYRAVCPEKTNKIVFEVRKDGKFAKGIIFESRNKLRSFLIDIGAYGKLAKEKEIPGAIFSLPSQKISLFLNRLFSCDGTIYLDTNTNSWRVSYSSASEPFARQVQHLLLKFGVISVLRKRYPKTGGKIFESYEIEIRGENARTFLNEIGFYGKKEERQEKALFEMRSLKRNPNTDTIPKEIWGQYRPKNWAEAGRAMGYKHPKSTRESIRYAPSRQKLLQIAIADRNGLVERLATSDIYWDEISGIEELAGEFEVYDISVPGNHNFVANDIIVHNSYSMSVVLEEFARQPPEIKERLSVIAIDTVGIFWTLKVANKLNAKELEQWDLRPEKTDVRVMVPKGKLSFYEEKGLPVDGAFTIKTSELDDTEWLAMFKLTWKDPEGVLLTRVITSVKEKLGTYYSIDDIIAAVKADTETEELAKRALVNRLNVAKTWGLLEKEGTKMSEIAKPGAITVVDVSAYRQAIGMEGTRDIIVALLGKKLFEERMLFRKEEEIKLMKGEGRKSSMPIIWMFIDEAHMFMPRDEDNIALSVLLEWVRVGRQPGLSLVLATQRPNRLHPDCISQCDLFISHRMTAKPDIEAVSTLRPSYLHQDLDKYYAEMPKEKGFALIIDDNTEKIWMVRIRPRLSWDGGVTASAFTD